MYYLMFGIPIVIHPLKISHRTKGMILSLSFTLLAVFRFGAGADYFSYAYLYYLLPTNPIAAFMGRLPQNEIGFKLLMLPFRYLNLPYEVFVAAISIVILIFMYLWIEKNSNSIAYSYLVYYALFFVVWNLSSIRQGLVLALGCYLLFNSKYEWNWIQKVAIVIALYLLHVTALFYLVLLLAENIKWDQKKLTYLVIFSLGVSLIPLSAIALKLANFPFLARIIHYVSLIDAPFGFWDIKSIPRILLIAVVLYHYEQLRKSGKIQKRVLDAYVIGVSFFFILRFSELIGARISIYGYFLAIIIFPAILELYSHKKIEKILAQLGLVLLCGLYLEKDLLAMVNQAGINANGYYVPYTSLFEKSTVTFNNPYYFRNNYTGFVNHETCLSEMNAYLSERTLSPSNISDTSQYFAVKFPDGSYGLLDTDGGMVLKKYSTPIEYYTDIIRLNDIEYFRPNGDWYDSTQGTWMFQTLKAQHLALTTNERFWTEVKRENLNQEVARQVEQTEQFKLVDIRTLSQSSNLNFVDLLYFGHGTVYRIYSKEMVLLSNDYYFGKPEVLESGVVVARNSCGLKYFNQNGTLIWMQPD